MAFTDNCDLFVAVHEDGVNRVIQHIMRQRPSWFNYGSADVASPGAQLWCHPIDVTSHVINFANPFFTVMPPFPVIGSDNPLVLTGFCAQLTKALIDFHPGKTVNLPAELNPPLKPQRFSLQFTVCGGLVCPSDRELEQIPVGSAPFDLRLATFAQQPYPPITVSGPPICFCLDVFVVGRFELTPNGFLLGKVEGLEIVDIKPEQLEANLECYLRMSVNVVLRQKLAIALQALALSFPLLNMGTIKLFPTPNPPVPNNPAIEEDQLKVFITMTT